MPLLLCWSFNANVVQCLSSEQWKNPSFPNRSCVDGDRWWSLYTLYEGSDTSAGKWICSEWFFVMFDLMFSPNGSWLYEEGWEYKKSTGISCFFRAQVWDRWQPAEPTASLPTGLEYMHYTVRYGVCSAGKVAKNRPSSMMEQLLCIS